MKNKVLLLCSFLTSGHHRAAQAVEKGMGKLFPQVETAIIDVFEKNNPFLRKAVGGSYFNLLKKAPRIWGYLYDNRKILEGTKKFREFFQRANSEKFKNLLLQYNPRLIVCTQALSCGIVAFLKEEGKLDLPLIGILTDFFPHSYWLQRSVDAYIVANEESRQYFVERGVNKEKIFVLGIPTDPQFSQKHDEKELKEKWKLNPHLPALLVMGGGTGFGPLEETVRELGEFGHSLQTIVVCGRNEKLTKRQKKISQNRQTIFGYLDKLDQQIENNDI